MHISAASLRSKCHGATVEQLLAHLRAFSDALQPFRALLGVVIIVIFGISIIVVIYDLFVQTIDNMQARRERRGPTWYCSSWKQDSNGNWLRQPILSIDGAKYVFDTPQEYIAVFQELGRRCGDPNGNIKRNIEEMHQAARYRASVRTAAGLPPDSPVPVKPAAPQEPPPIPPLEELLEAARNDPVAVASPSIPPEPQLPPVVPPRASPAPPVQTLPPQEGIVLKLKRSQRQGTMGANIYILDARIDASAEVRAIILRHRLGSRVIYESRSRQKRAEATKANLERSHDGTSLFAPGSAQLRGAGNALWHLGRAAVSATIASLSLRVTVDSLFSGVHVECKSMEELLEAEAAIKQAKGNLEGYIDVLSTFDGREQIV